MRTRVITFALLAAATALADQKSEPRNAEPKVYQAADRDGKLYNYRETPFGVVKTPVKPEGQAEAPKPQATPVNVKVTEAGDTLKFERPGPFGAYRWERKKTELSPAEREMWEQSRRQAK